MPFLDSLKNTLNKMFAPEPGQGPGKAAASAAPKRVLAPTQGWVFPLNKSADPAHQEEILGKGVCIMPLDGKLVAPFDGIVDMIFDTKHAVNLKSTTGLEVLIHCGIDTVKLDGKGFTLHVQEGEAIKTGQLLLEYDGDVVTNAGYSLETQVVVTNTAEFKSVTQMKTGDCMPGDLILEIE